LLGDDARLVRGVRLAAGYPRDAGMARRDGTIVIRSGLGGGGRGLEVLADQLALLGQKLVEVLVDVLLADRFRGQVKLSDLLKVAGPRGRRILQPDVTTGVRRSLGG
jgi:hypothetical protein